MPVELDDDTMLVVPDDDTMFVVSDDDTMFVVPDVVFVALELDPGSLVAPSLAPDGVDSVVSVTVEVNEEPVTWQLG